MTRFMFVGENARTSKTITIGGTKLPPLKSFKVQYYDIQVNSYRDITQNANLHKETIAWDKVKLVCEWGYLSKDEAKVVLNACKGKEFTECTYFDPNSLEWKTINVYRGDREITKYREIYDDTGNIVGVDFSGSSVNFIEQ